MMVVPVEIIASLIILSSLETHLAFEILCPRVCVCLNSTSLQISCEGADLTELPVDLSHSVTSLDLTQNHLKSLRATTLGYRPKLVELKLKENGLEEINEGAFRGLTSLQELDLSENNLSVVDRTTFRDLPSLLHLDLSSNQLTDVDGAFSAPRELSRLDLRQNRLTAISHLTFSRASSLRYLRLDDNFISYVDSRAFLDQTKLMYFVLKGNPVGHLGRIYFNSTFLSYVDMSECGLARVPKGIPDSVRYLQLRRNRLIALSRKSFELCSNVTILVMDENGLEEIEPGTLGSMVHLQQLWLNGNRLRSIPSPLPKSVQRLFMDLNSVGDLSEDCFPVSSQLNTLSLMGNNISILPEMTFNRLSLLRHLDLSGNDIRTLEQNTFLGNPVLQLLQLSKNPLNRFHSGCFSGLRELHTLSIAFISSTTLFVDEDLFADLTNLRKLQLDSSPGLIRTIVTSKALLSSLASLQELNLDNSDIETLTPDFPDYFPNLAVLRLFSHRWFCDSDLIWLRDWIVSTPVHLEDPDRIKCHSPEFLSQRKITGLSNSEFEIVSRTNDRISNSPKHFSPLYTDVQIPPLGNNNLTILHSTVHFTTFDTVPDPNQDGKRDVDLLPRPGIRKIEVIGESRGLKDKESGFLSWDELKVRLSDVEDSYYREDGEMNDEKRQERKSLGRKLDQIGARENISFDSRGKFTPIESDILPPKEHSRNDLDNTRIIITIAMTITATLLITIAVVSCIVYLCWRKNSKDSAAKSHPSGTIHLNSSNEDRCNSHVGTINSSGTITGRPLAVMATESGGDIVMSLVPGRDINHEGPLRVYKWEDF